MHTLTTLRARASALRGVRWRPGLRTRVLAGSAAIVLALAGAIALSAADHLRVTATESAVDNAEAIVRGYIDPILTEEELAFDASVDPEIAGELNRLVAAGDMRWINVWTRDGRVIYSTDPDLTGVRLGIGHSVATAFAGASIAAFGTRADAAVVADRLPERFLHIHVPIRGATDGNPIGVFEVYLDARPIEERADDTRRDVFQISVGFGAALLALLWAAFAGASRRLTAQNQSLVELNERLNGLAADLRRREARFRSLVQNSSDVVTVVDGEQRVMYESDAVRRVLGREPLLPGVTPFPDLVHPDDASWCRTFIEGLLASRGGTHAGELRLRHAEGSWRWIEAVGHDLRDDPAVEGVVLNYRDVTDRRSLDEQLQHQAFHDPLTGLANRALFADRLTHALARLRDGAQLAVLFLDVDDLKLVNDSLGHEAGDELLRTVAARLVETLRPEDTAARLSGDEFGVLLENATPEEAAATADAVLAALSRPIALAPRQVVVTASVGIALADAADADAERTADAVLRNADVAMHSAKALGKGRRVFYDPQMHASAIRRLEVRERLEAGLAGGEFVLVYQPVVELVSDRPMTMEALARWRQPDGHLALPSEFIPFAEETGLIVPLGRWVLETALHQLAAWKAGRPDLQDLGVSVNVAPRQLREADFVESVRMALAASGVAAEDLLLELTESALLEVDDETAERLTSIKRLGVRLALDDFGTGYSSLSHLRRFPIDVVKIDRSFIAGVDDDDGGERTLVHSIIRLARSLDLETVAEGIERREQLITLRALGARFGQGFHIAEPLDPEAALRFLERRQRLAG